METIMNRSTIGAVTRHWYWALAAVLLAVLVIAATGEGAAPALADDAGCNVAGDLNKDCAVSGVDLYIVLAHYGDTGEPIPGSGGFSCSEALVGDITGDCAVSGNDLFQVLQNFGSVA
jgi:hypothetical protein